MSSPGSRLAGLVYFTVNGVTYEMAGKLTWNPQRVTRSSLESQSAVSGYKEMPKPGRITGTIRDGQELRVEDFNEMTGVTIVFQNANGKWVTGTAMWTVGDSEVDTEEGTFPVEFEGRDGCVVEEGV